MSRNCALRCAPSCVPVFIEVAVSQFRFREVPFVKVFQPLIASASVLACSLTFASSQPATHTLGIQYAPYVHHWQPHPEHNNTPNLMGLEYKAPSQWVFGGVLFDNSFDQPSQYYYVGKQWSFDMISPNLYAKLTAGPLLGYTGEYEDKIPVNRKGVGLGAIPAVGYQLGSANAQFALLGTAGFMFTFGADLLSW